MLLVIPIASILTLVLIWTSVRRPLIGVAAILLGTLVDVLFVVPPSAELGLNVYIQDAVFCALAFSLLWRVLTYGVVRFLSLPLLVFGLLLLLNLVIGLEKHGTAAGVDVRNSFYFLVGVLYFGSFRWSQQDIEGLIKTWLWFGLCLLIIVYFRFSAEFAGLQIARTWIEADPTGVAFRVVNSSQAYVLGALTVMLVHRYVFFPERKPAAFLLALLCLAVLALQHRSVWVATAGGITAGAFIPGSTRRKMLLIVFLTIITAAVLLLPLMFFGFLGRFEQSIAESASRMLSLSTGTFGARVAGWIAILDFWNRADLVTQLIGEPFGGGYAGQPRSPHNLILQMLLRVGPVGLLALMIFFIRLAWGLYRNAKIYRDPYAALFLMMLASLLLYYVPYSIQPEQAILLGTAAAIARRRVGTTSSATPSSNSVPSVSHNPSDVAAYPIARD